MIFDKVELQKIEVKEEPVSSCENVYTPTIISLHIVHRFLTSFLILSDEAKFNFCNKTLRKKKQNKPVYVS